MRFGLRELHPAIVTAVAVRADEDPGPRASKPIRRLTGILERLPGHLEQQPLLRIHLRGFPRRNAEQLRVERVDAVEEATVAGRDLSSAPTGRHRSSRRCPSDRRGTSVIASTPSSKSRQNALGIIGAAGEPAAEPMIASGSSRRRCRFGLLRKRRSGWRASPGDRLAIRARQVIMRKARLTRPATGGRLHPTAPRARARTDLEIRQLRRRFRAGRVDRPAPAHRDHRHANGELRRQQGDRRVVPHQRRGQAEPGCSVEPVAEFESHERVEPHRSQRTLDVDASGRQLQHVRDRLLHEAFEQRMAAPAGWRLLQVDRAGSADVSAAGVSSPLSLSSSAKSGQVRCARRFGPPAGIERHDGGLNRIERAAISASAAMPVAGASAPRPRSASRAPRSRGPRQDQPPTTAPS